MGGVVAGGDDKVDGGAGLGAGGGVGRVESLVAI